MSLVIDARRQEMLAEMGIRFVPLREAPPVAEDAPEFVQQPVAQPEPELVRDGIPVTAMGDAPGPAEWMVVGDAIGDEREGKLVDNMLRAIGLSRDDGVFIAAVPDSADEIAQCEPVLRAQVERVQPKVILVTGRFAAQALLGTTEAAGRLRGRVHEFMGVPVVVTYPPAYLLRNAAEKAKAWADLCLALEVVAQAGAGSRRSAAT